MANDIITPPGTSLDPSLAFEAITKSDTVNFTYQGIPRAAKSIFVGTAGNLVLIGINGETVTFKNVANGTLLRVMAVRVNSTNTTATDMVALF